VAAPALWLLSVLATIFFLKFASELLIPIAIAVLISCALEPVVAFLARHHIRRWAGASLTLLLISGLSGLSIYSLSDDALRGGRRPQSGAFWPGPSIPFLTSGP
jgi:predicted PurR-regulated permease PerM